MGLYNIYQWLIFFYIYCFLGWCIESTIVSVESKKMINRGFLSGPLLPIYGLGAVLVLFITLPFRDNLLAVYFVGMIGATILEYFTGWLMAVSYTHLREKEDYMKAIEIINEGIKENPEEGFLYYNRACFYAAISELDLALNDVFKSIKLNDFFVEYMKKDRELDRIRTLERYKKIFN